MSPISARLYARDFDTVIKFFFLLLLLSPGRIIVVLFLTKYAVPRQIKPGILKVTTSRGQRNLHTVVFLLAAKKKAACYRIVS